MHETLITKISTWAPGTRKLPGSAGPNRSNNRVFR